MAHFASRLLTAVATVALLAAVPAGEGQFGKAVGISSASAQQMGTSPYNHPARNRSFAAQMQMQQKMLAGANSGASAGGLGALNQWVTNYNSSSTSIGNLNEITQILGDGASGSIDANAHQDSSGSNQTSQASTDVEISTDITETHNHSESSSNSQPTGTP